MSRLLSEQAGRRVTSCAALLSRPSAPRAEPPQPRWISNLFTDLWLSWKDCNPLPVFSRRLSTASVLSSRKYLMEGRCCSIRRVRAPGGWVSTARAPCSDRSGGHSWRPCRGCSIRGRLTPGCLRLSKSSVKWNEKLFISNFLEQSISIYTISAFARNHFSKSQENRNNSGTCGNAQWRNQSFISAVIFWIFSFH